MTTATIALAVMMMMTPALEDGATFDGGICWEADGTQGIAMLDGSCMTPADYDTLFSYENLAATPNAYNPTVSIAETYQIDPEAPPASDRPIGTGLVEAGTERTFKQVVQAAHLPHAE